MAKCGIGKGKSRTEPTFPKGKIAKKGDITIEHYYPNDHEPAHIVVKEYLPKIRKAGNKIGKWLDYKKWETKNCP